MDEPWTVSWLNLRPLSILIILDDYIGRTTGSVGLYMIRSNHEKASGGPFFRSLLTRADPTGEDLYEIYYYNMGSTDPMRTGLQGPHVVSFTDGGAPSSSLYARNADWGWVDALSVSVANSTIAI